VTILTRIKLHTTFLCL